MRTDPVPNLYTGLVYARTIPVIGRLAYMVLKALGAEIPRSVKIGSNFHLVHGGFGVVIHPTAVIGSNVRIYHGVTIGRADVYRSAERSKFAGVHVGDGAIIGAGAKVLGSSGVLSVGARTVVGANAVLLQSTEEDEVWMGNPAYCVGSRLNPPFA